MAIDSAFGKLVGRCVLLVGLGVGGGVLGEGDRVVGAWVLGLGVGDWLGDKVLGFGVGEREGKSLGFVRHR